MLTLSIYNSLYYLAFLFKYKLSITNKLLIEKYTHLLNEVEKSSNVVR